jgi:hypothetical protein
MHPEQTDRPRVRIERNLRHWMRLDWVARTNGWSFLQPIARSRAWMQYNAELQRDVFDATLLDNVFPLPPPPLPVCSLRDGAMAAKTSSCLNQFCLLALSSTLSCVIKCCTTVVVANNRAEVCNDVWFPMTTTEQIIITMVNESKAQRNCSDRGLVSEWG